ncbi:hypothetical protein H9P43_001063 [Blastocladiella emersonii ATCC 22665]|nr:hypothetical protein H9P43_001063 [Blastocladiella emersonii ATCC 22665]
MKANAKSKKTAHDNLQHGAEEPRRPTQPLGDKKKRGSRPTLAPLPNSPSSPLATPPAAAFLPQSPFSPGMIPMLTAPAASAAPMFHYPTYAIPAFYPAPPQMAFGWAPGAAPSPFFAMSPTTAPIPAVPAAPTRREASPVQSTSAASLESEPLGSILESDDEDGSEDDEPSPPPRRSRTVTIAPDAPSAGVVAVAGTMIGDLVRDLAVVEMAEAKLRALNTAKRFATVPAPTSTGAPVRPSPRDPVAGAAAKLLGEVVVAETGQLVRTAIREAVVEHLHRDAVRRIVDEMVEDEMRALVVRALRPSTALDEPAGAAAEDDEEADLWRNPDDLAAAVRHRAGLVLRAMVVDELLAPLAVRREVSAHAAMVALVVDTLLSGIAHE